MQSHFDLVLSIPEYVENEEYRMITKDIMNLTEDFIKASDKKENIQITKLSSQIFRLKMPYDKYVSYMGTIGLKWMELNEFLDPKSSFNVRTLPGMFFRLRGGPLNKDIINETFSLMFPNLWRYRGRSMIKDPEDDQIVHFSFLFPSDTRADAEYQAIMKILTNPSNSTDLYENSEVTYPLGIYIDRYLYPILKVPVSKYINFIEKVGVDLQKLDRYLHNRCTQCGMKDDTLIIEMEHEMERAKERAWEHAKEHVQADVRIMTLNRKINDLQTENAKLKQKLSEKDLDVQSYDWDSKVNDVILRRLSALVFEGRFDNMIVRDVERMFE